jgi:hypothetical protein
MKKSVMALKVIEGLAMVWEDDKKTLSLADSIISDIFRYSHYGLGECKCRGGIDRWDLQLKKTYRELRKARII